MIEKQRREHAAEVIAGLAQLSGEIAQLRGEQAALRELVERIVAGLGLDKTK
jgi:hypothetical protein